MDIKCHSLKPRHLNMKGVLVCIKYNNYCSKHIHITVE